MNMYMYLCAVKRIYLNIYVNASVYITFERVRSVTRRNSIELKFAVTQNKRGCQDMANSEYVAL